MAEALQNIGNLWDHLSDLHQKDPEKYKEVIEDSAKEYAKLKLPPLPHTCIIVRDANSAEVGYFVNILAWERLPEDRNGALPMAGGFMTRKFEKVIYSLAVNDKIMNGIMVKGGTKDKNDLFRLVVAFLENANPDLKLLDKSWSLIRGRDYEGNLNEIQQLFMTPKQTSQLKTDNPKSLLDQITQINTEGNGNESQENSEEIKLKTTSESRKRLVEEVRSTNGNKKENTTSEFEQNLKKKYSKDNSTNTETNKSNEKPVKTFETQSQRELNPVSTKRLQPKKPLFGRAFCPRTEQVKLKFLLNGVQDIKDIFLYLPEEGYFGLQTTNGYSTKDAILPGVIKDWQIQDQNLDLSSNYPVLCVTLNLANTASEDKENNDP